QQREHLVAEQPAEELAILRIRVLDVPPELRDGSAGRVAEEARDPLGGDDAAVEIRREAWRLPRLHLDPVAPGAASRIGRALQLAGLSEHRHDAVLHRSDIAGGVIGPEEPLDGPLGAVPVLAALGRSLTREPHPRRKDRRGDRPLRISCAAIQREAPAAGDARARLPDDRGVVDVRVNAELDARTWHLSSETDEQPSCLHGQMTKVPLPGGSRKASARTKTLLPESSVLDE